MVMNRDAAGRAVGADRGDRDLLLAEEDAGERLGLEVGERRALQLGEAADLGLGETDRGSQCVAERVGGLAHRGAVDLEAAVRVPAVELARVGADRVEAVALDAQEHLGDTLGDRGIRAGGGCGGRGLQERRSGHRLRVGFPGGII
jgi:hypothetical protein